MAEEQLKIEAQEAVNELWAGDIIPFKLTATQVEAGGGPGYYRVHFLEPRLRLLYIYWNRQEESFKTAVLHVGQRTVGKRSRAKEAGHVRISL